MKNKSNNKKIKIGLLILILCITIGYALLRTALNINGIASIPRVSWDVHFDNYQKLNTTNIEPTTEPSIPAESKTTTISYAVAFTAPGDLYEFTVDAVNDGTIDAMIESVSSKLDDVEIDSEHPLPAYLDYSVTYEDGTPIQPNQLLASNSHDTYKVKIGFKDVDPSELPSEAQVLHLDLTVTYIQADDNAIDRRSAGLWVDNTKITDVSPEEIMQEVKTELESRCLNDSLTFDDVPDVHEVTFEATDENTADVSMKLVNDVDLIIYGGVGILTNTETGDSIVYTGSMQVPIVVYGNEQDQYWTIPTTLHNKYSEFNGVVINNSQVKYNGVVLNKSLEDQFAEVLDSLDTECIKKLIGEPQVTQPEP